MALIQPLFQDGTYVKTNDLNTLTSYINSIGAILGNLFQPGIIGGLQLIGSSYSSYQTGTISCTPGFAVLESGQLVQFDSTDLSIPAAGFYSAIATSSATIPVYVVQTGTTSLA